MPTVTDIKETEKGRYALFCDGEFLFSVDDETFCKSGVTKGCELSSDEIAELRENSDLQKAKQKAFALLALRDHTEKELFDKLCRSFDEDTSRSAVDVMVRLEYVNDEETAENMARELVATRMFSLRRARRYMREKGIDRELCDSLLEQYDDVETLERVIEKKFRAKLASGARQKVFASLTRLGFEYADIRRALDEPAEDFE